MVPAWEAFALGWAVALGAALAAEARRRRALRGRLEGVRAARRAPGTADRPRVEDEEEGVSGTRPGFRAAAAWLLAGLQRLLSRRGRTRRLEARLRQAGLRLRAAEYLALRGVAGAALGAIALLASRHAGLALGAAAAGFVLPEVLVEQRTRRRRRAFVAQLPDALTAVANSLRSGFSFLQAVEVTARELGEPAASELLQVVRETQVDIALEDALANLYGRVPLPEVQLVVTAVIIQRQVGGNLAGLLDQVAETVRLRLRLERELRALTAQGRLSGWIVGLLPAALGGFLALVNPGYVGTLWHEAAGRVLLAAGVLLQVVGALAIRRLVRLEV